MSDIYLAWGDDLQFAPNGDFRTVAQLDLAIQRLARRLATNPAIRDVSGNVLQVGADPINQDYGKGIGRMIDAVDSPENRQIISGMLRIAAAEESDIINQNIPPTITFSTIKERGLKIATMEFATVTGQVGSINASY